MGFIKPGNDYLNSDNNLSSSNSNTLNKECLNKTYVELTLKSYKTQIKVFSLLEIFSVLFVVCILSFIKNKLEINPYFHEPNNLESGCFKKNFKNISP